MNKDLYVLVEYLKGQVADITYMMLAAANQVSQETGGRVVAVLLGHEVDVLAMDLAADQVLYIDQPVLNRFSQDAYVQVLSNLIENDPPRLFLFGHTSMGMDVICGVGVKLDIPVISQCQKLGSEDGRLKFVSQICGGKIMAEGELPEPAALVSMIPGKYKPENGKSAKPPTLEKVALPEPEVVKVKLLEYVEPDETDVDISKEAVLIAVGRGLQNQDDLELIEEVALAFGGHVCASRPIIDQGWLPTSRLVGKSGKRVAPQLYLALGISGAPEHIEGMLDSELIVSINTDQNAPIFDFAHYGAEVDMIDFLEALTEQIKLAA